MIKVILETKSGHTVHTTSMPPFSPEPEVLMWGDRVFTPWTKEIVKGVYTYREAFLYVLAG